jgi:hypothetical protein
MNGAMNGALLENYAVSEIQKSYQNAGKEAYFIITGIRTPKKLTLLWRVTVNCTR